MKVKFELMYIGEHAFYFNNKYELFDFYFNNIGNIDAPLILPFYDEYSEKYLPKLHKILSKINDYINVDINVSDDNIMNHINNARRNNKNNELELTKFKDSYKKY